MIRAVISDLGKVVVHFDNRIFFARLAEVSGRSMEDIIRLAFQGSGLLNAFDAGDLDPDAFRAEVCGRVGVALDHERFYAIYNPIFRLIPSTLEVLRDAHRACRLVLLSNTDPMRYGFLLRTYPEIRTLFDASVVSCEERLMKPDPRIYRLALERAGAPAGESVFVDDRPENVEAARRLGLYGIVFEEGRTDLRAELRRIGLPV
jgi:FMN phosphatase YigB (HAD superfamily)